MNLQARWQRIQTAAYRTGWYWSLTAIAIVSERLSKALLPLLPKGQLLDVGCGERTLESRLRDQGLRYIGLDIDPGNTNVDLRGDNLRLPFRDASFDVVHSGGVLEHVTDPDLALREYLRVLRPGGWLMVGVPHMFPVHREPVDYWRWTEHGLDHALRKTGFEVGRIYPLAGPIAFWGTMLSAGTLAVLAPPSWPGPFLAINAVFAQLAAWLDRRLFSRAFAVHCCAVAWRPGGALERAATVLPPS